jgi:hypothetical protein
MRGEKMSENDIEIAEPGKIGNITQRSEVGSQRPDVGRARWMAGRVRGVSGSLPVVLEETRFGCKPPAIEEAVALNPSGHENYAGPEGTCRQ